VATFIDTKAAPSTGVEMVRPWVKTAPPFSPDVASAVGSGDIDETETAAQLPDKCGIY